MTGNNKSTYISIALFAVIVCSFVWLATPGNNPTELYSDTGVWDFRALFTGDESYWLSGPVEYIPGLLAPEEFAAREGEALIGYPENVSQYATSRLLLLMPDDGYYAFYGRSIDYACRLFVNGNLILETGNPGETRKNNIPNTGNISLTLKADNGVIEIIQQVSILVHREGDSHNGWLLSKRNIRVFLANDFIESIKLGIFLALFFVHVILFLLLRKSKANLYFALLCLMWVFRTGVTGVKIFTDIFPWMSWDMKFRIEYLSFPVTAVLLPSLLDILFPHILPKWFRHALYCVSAVIAAIFLFANTVFMSYALLWCEALYVPAIIYIIIRFAMKLRRLNTEHGVFLTGTGIFFLAAIYDIFYTNNYFNLHSFGIFQNLTSVSMLLFTFCQVIAVFIVTAREMETTAAENVFLKEKAHLIEQQLSALHDHYADVAKIQGNPATPDSLETAALETLFREYGLSKRETDVAALLVNEGLLAKEIGKRLFISTYTVNEHIANIYQKFGVKRRPEFMTLFVNR